MKYTVVWTSEAQDSLCELYMAVSNRAELSRIVENIEAELARRPESLGESRHTGCRVAMESHIGLTFEIHPDDCMVQVIQIGWLP